jgi:hypothetical protein
MPARHFSVMTPSIGVFTDVDRSPSTARRDSVGSGPLNGVVACDLGRDSLDFAPRGRARHSRMLAACTMLAASLRVSTYIRLKRMPVR